jgi:hypothetical protein
VKQGCDASPRACGSTRRAVATVFMQAMRPSGRPAMYRQTSCSATASASRNPSAEKIRSEMPKSA